MSQQLGLDVIYLSDKLAPEQQQMLDVCEGIQSDLSVAFAGFPIRQESGLVIPNGANVNLWVSSHQFHAGDGEFRGITTHRDAMWNAVISPFVYTADDPSIHATADQVGELYRSTDPGGFVEGLMQAAANSEDRERLIQLYEYLRQGPWNVLSSMSKIDTQEMRVVHPAPMTERQVDIRELPANVMMVFCESIGLPLYTL